ncbi:MAG: hypothetical protein IJE29_05320, partial [Firmicutes bacterium]|nr:hypothetical protein [Bacillota bacterium]
MTEPKQKIHWPEDETWQNCKQLNKYLASYLEDIDADAADADAENPTGNSLLTDYMEQKMNDRQEQMKTPPALKQKTHFRHTKKKILDLLGSIVNKFYSQAEKEELEMPLKEHKIESPQFTAAMKETHTILVPQMLPIHFKLLQGIFRRQGYNIEFLENTSYAVTEQGL